MKIERFLQQSYTAYHAVQCAKEMLDKAGFTPVSIESMPTLKVGDKCYTVQGGTSLFAFKIGKEAQIMLAECHTDSPCLHVKTRETTPSKEGYRINVEKYGGLLLYSMLDIPLKVAGRVVTEENDGVKVKIVQSAQNVVIPSLCVHHTANQNELNLNVQTDMLPLVGDVRDVYEWIAPDEKVLDADLFVVPAVTPYRSGANAEYFSSPRIDNLTSVYTAVQALIHTTPKCIGMIACFDNEEIGSGTKRGAGSAYLMQLGDAIAKALGKEDSRAMWAAGMALSVDNGHAEHPAHPEKSDVVNAPVLGGGVVVKHHVNYATDGVSAGILKRMLDMANIPRQDYYNRSDIACGSTLGNIAARALVVDTADIGIAQLAMHSAVETASIKDIETMQKALSVFLGSKLIRQDDYVGISL